MHFFSLIDVDLVGYSILKKKLENFANVLSTIKIDQEDIESRVEEILGHQRVIWDAVESLYNLSQFRGTEFENILIGQLRDKGLKFPDDSSGVLIKQEFSNNAYNTILATRNESLVYSVFNMASAIIYRRLVHATIDLGKSGAKAGEVLNLYVTWKNPKIIDKVLEEKESKIPMEDSRLTLGKYYLRETGWKTEILDMFALVKRIKEPSATRSTPGVVSPSNFKGSGGAVLMWTFHSLDKGIKPYHSKRRNAPTSANNSRRRFEKRTFPPTSASDTLGRLVIRRKNAFVNFLQPSLGLNVSYLDFSTEKDVEIGTGLQFGLFKNKVFFGYGLNLHLIRPKEQFPAYYYVGFSFAKLSDLFKDSKSIAVN